MDQRGWLVRTLEEHRPHAVAVAYRCSAQPFLASER
jgi:hypothetical protein